MLGATDVERCNSEQVCVCVCVLRDGLWKRAPQKEDTQKMIGKVKRCKTRK